MKKKISTWTLSLATLLVATTLYAGVGALSWSGTNSWKYNNEISGDKPGDQWDTQKTDQEANPVKWVLHKSGGNPVMWLRIDDTVSSTDITTIGSDFANRYTTRGITANGSNKMTINGIEVVVIGGLDKAKDVRYNTAIFWRKGTKRAYHIELNAPSSEFSTYEPAFMGMVQTIKLLP